MSRVENRHATFRKISSNAYGTNPSASTNGSSSNGNDHVLLPAASQSRANGQLPNSPLSVSIISFLLGGLVFTSLGMTARSVLDHFGWSGTCAWARPQLGVYLAAMGLFHSLEFWTTAAFNPAKLTVDSFLLNNGISYHLAHLLGLTEYALTSYFYPQKYKTFLGSATWIIAECVEFAYKNPLSRVKSQDHQAEGPALIALLTGQALRSFAMIHASQSFSHIVKVIKHDDHVLITHGVYRFFRHPSYVGFFYWALATQVLLGNIVSTVMFALVLGRFFYARIIDEEKHLVRFFGNDYVEYRKRVGTGLPFPIPSA